MSSISQPEHLNNHHRETLQQLFEHPTSHNIEWHAVISLLEAVGTVEELHDGKFLVQLGGEAEFLRRPENKDIDMQQVVDLRRMLTGAGYAARQRASDNSHAQRMPRLRPPAMIARLSIANVARVTRPPLCGQKP